MAMNTQVIRKLGDYMNKPKCLSCGEGICAATIAGMYPVMQYIEAWDENYNLVYKGPAGQAGKLITWHAESMFVNASGQVIIRVVHC